MALPPLLRSRVAPFAAVYGVILGSANNWSDDVPGVRPLFEWLVIGGLTVVPALFGYLIVREAREPSIMYGVFAPVYAVMVGVIASMLTMTGSAGDTGAFTLIVMPIPAFVAIIGGLHAGARAHPPGRSRDPKSRESVAPLPPLLTHVSDPQAGDWLKASVTSFAETVASFLPGHFEAYARLNHPPEPLHYPPQRTGSLPPELIDPLIDHLKPATTTPAKCFFAVWEGFGGLVVPPDLEPQLDLPRRRYHVFAGPLATAHTSFGAVPFHHQSANLWWPADQAWCVATEVDLERTFVGGSRRCIASILADSRLGAVETTAATPHD